MKPKNTRAKKSIIAPSILSADFSRLGDEMREMESYGANWFHVDVMDGHFVPNLTLGPPVVKSIRKCTKATLDCHLMVRDPIKMIPWFAEAGADVITIHLEAMKDVRTALKLIKKLGLKVGLSIKPKTKVKAIEPYLGLVDLVLVMSVEPGFGGQSFMPEMLKKVEQLKTLRKIMGLNYLIEIDGGINATTGAQACAAGVDVFVAGSALFSAKNREIAYRELKEALK